MERCYPRITNDIDTLKPEPEPECNAGDHIGDNDHRCADHDAQYQSVDDIGSTSDSSGFNGTDLYDRKTFTEVLHEPTGVSRTCKRTGRRNL